MNYLGTRIRIRFHVHLFSIFFATFSTSSFSTPSLADAQQINELVVAAQPMRIRLGNETLDAIEPGDLLTVLEERDDSYLVTTHSGGRGAVSKVLAVPQSESVPIYDQLIKEKPKEGRLYALRGAAWRARGEQQRALQDFDRAIKSGYEKPDAYAGRAELQLTLGQHDKALADYSLAIKLDSKNAAHYINRAAVHMSSEAYKLAVKDYDKAINLDKTQSATFRQRAAAQKLLGDNKKAIADYNEAIKLAPKSVTAIMERGYLLSEMNEAGKAAADFSEVIKLDRTNVEAFINRGLSRGLAGDEKNALADFGQATRLAPSNAFAHENRAWLLASAQDAKVRNGKQAVEAATIACELQAFQDVNGLRALAAAFAEDGQFDKAMGWQEKVIEMVEDDEKPFERQLLKDYGEEKPFRGSVSEPASDDAG